MFFLLSILFILLFVQFLLFLTIIINKVQCGLASLFTGPVSKLFDEVVPFLPLNEASRNQIISQEITRCGIRFDPNSNELIEECKKKCYDNTTGFRSIKRLVFICLAVFVSHINCILACYNLLILPM